jgi:hypothetical protein
LWDFKVIIIRWCLYGGWQGTFNVTRSIHSIENGVWSSQSKNVWALKWKGLYRYKCILTMITSFSWDLGYVPRRLDIWKLSLSYIDTKRNNLQTTEDSVFLIAFSVHTRISKYHWSNLLKIEYSYILICIQTFLIFFSNLITCLYKCQIWLF